MADEMIEGTATEEVAVDQAPVSEGVDTTPAAESATPRDEAPAQQEESFIDVSNLPEELKPHWKRMHGAYTKFREDLKQGREARAQIERFYGDPAYRQQVLAQFGGQPATRQESQSPVSQHGAPAEVVDRVKAKLPPELQWMAQSLADSQWETVQSMMAPLQEQQKQMDLQSKNQAYDEAVSALDGKYPGWEQQEGEMNQVLTWLQKGDLKHPRYGNRLEALYKLTQLLNGNDGFAVTQAAKRMAQAARSRTVTGNVGRPAEVNWQEKIRGTKNNHEAIQLAVKQAEAEMERMGVAIRD